MACVETELALCAQMDAPKKRERVGLCFAAAVDVAYADVGDAPLRTIAEAVCGRESRCGRTVPPTCVDDVTASKKGAAHLMAAVRPPRVTALSQCIASRPCDDEDPVAHCP